MNANLQPGADALEQGLQHILRSPKTAGRVEMIVRRPAVDTREELDAGELSVIDGLSGDSWRARGSRQMSDGSAHPDMQITIMNARVVQLVATHRDRWALAGDQFYVDLDLSRENLPIGTRLKVGNAVVEVSAMPHLGCRKFVDRFGKAAAMFVNSRRGKTLCLRGINARVVEGGTVRRGDAIRKLD